ncbi:MAG: hypothetical protein JNJ88_21590 [Planctomycetes bacterium]|nr:hypothetical protein [Planctomycetota bacterium]
MHTALRLTIAALVLAGLSWVAIGLYGDGEPALGAQASELGGIGARACQKCHSGVYDEWAASAHAGAFVNPEVRKLSNEYANEQCIDCHAPRPVFETGIAKPPLPRTARRSEGVDCAACHAAGDHVAASSPTAAGACLPRLEPALKSADLCASCHDQHFTIAEWQETRFARDGVGCIDCHMLPSQRPGRAGRDHRSHSSTNIDMLQKSVELTVTVDGRTLRATLENVGAGHHFPTDERSRAADLLVRELRDDGSLVRLSRLDRLRNPYRDQVGAAAGLPYREESPLLEKRPESTLLPHGVKRSYSLELLPECTQVEVVLTYKKIPFPTEPAEILNDEKSFAEKKAFVVHRRVVKVP